MSTLIDVARESFLILDDDFRVISASPTFYETFLVNRQKTEKKLLYKLGNGQWDIPELKKMLGGILPKKKVVKNYKVEHNFQTIGRKTMLLNARQIDTVKLIILAIEDITDKENLKEKLAEYTKGLENKIAERTKELADKIKELELTNRSMVGRELKMVELKKELKDLKN